MPSRGAKWNTGCLRAHAVCLAGFLATLGWLDLGELGAQAQSASLAVTNGLIRWWPNPLDSRDEVTGQEGVVMGVQPPHESRDLDASWFTRERGWAQLKPAITNESFTICFWIRPQSNLYWHLLAQESEGTRWILRNGRDPNTLVIGDDLRDEEYWDETVRLEPDTWQHVAVARRSDGTSVIWRNGIRQVDGRRAHAWPKTARWLSVGNLPRGGQPFVGALSDLCVFDRVITEVDAFAIFATGRQARLPQNSRARIAARERAVAHAPVREAKPGPERQWKHRQFTTEDGLPGNSVHALLQAKDGFLWVGTESGLARFDGRNFRTFTAQNSPAMTGARQNVFSLTETSDGTIWAGGFGALLRVRDLEVTALTNGLPQRFIMQVMGRSDGSLWVAGFNDTLPRGPCTIRRYFPETGSSGAAIAIPGQLRRWAAAADGLWLATENPPHILFWDGQSEAAEVIARVSATPLEIYFANRAWLPEDTEVRTWRHEAVSWAEARLGTKGPRIPWSWNSSGVNAGRADGPGTLENHWIGVSHELARMRGDALELVAVPNRIRSSEIECLVPVTESGVWFGTDEDGLHYVEEQLVRVFTREDGLIGNDVRTVSAAADGTIWAATSEGMSCLQEGAWKSDLDQRTAAVIPDSTGEAWFAQAADDPHVIGRKTREAGRRMVFVDGVVWSHPNALRFDRTGALWISCQRGVSRLDPKALQPPISAIASWTLDPAASETAFRRFEPGKELPAAEPYGLVEDAEGAIWVGSLGRGLSRIAGDVVKTFTQDDGLPNPICVPLLLGRDHAMWMATPDGLVRYTGGRFEFLGVAGGWPEDTPLDAIEDDIGHLWVSGRRGIHRLVHSELGDYFAGRIPKVHSLTLGMRDGLLTPECSMLHYPSMAKTADGLIWVATRNGLAQFDPRRIKLNLQPPRSTLERILANRKEILLPASGQVAGILELAPGSGRQLEIHYAAIDLLKADRVQYRYRLEGHDTDWQPSTDLRAAFYTNLRPGQYRFRLKAANAQGLWNDVESVLSFAILPHFWETRTFLGLTAALVAGVVVWTHRHRLASQRKLQALQHRQDLMSEKARIAADMHDELGAALTQIAILGEVAQRQSADQAKARSTLQRISQAARDVTGTMSELVWATHPLNDTLDNLVARLRERAATQLQDSGIAMHLDFPETVPDRNVSATFRRNLVLILKESLTNVIKHARASRVEVTLSIHRNGLVLRIVDDGNGGQGEGHGHGLANMRRRAEELDGRFQRSSAEGSGWAIEVEVPLAPPVS